MIKQTKVCIDCGQEKPIEKFCIKGKTRHKVCNHCRYLRKRTYFKQWYQQNKKRANAQERTRRSNLRLEAIKAYGSKCSCCGETHIEFLTFDHVHTDGAKHRKELKYGQATFYMWLKKNNWPKTIRLLCWNCNCARYYYGYCPHERQHD